MDLWSFCIKQDLETERQNDMSDIIKKTLNMFARDVNMQFMLPMNSCTRIKVQTNLSAATFGWESEIVN